MHKKLLFIVIYNHFYRVASPPPLFKKRGGGNHVLALIEIDFFKKNFLYIGEYINSPMYSFFLKKKAIHEGI